MYESRSSCVNIFFRILVYQISLILSVIGELPSYTFGFSSWYTCAATYGIIVWLGYLLHSLSLWQDLLINATKNTRMNKREKTYTTECFDNVKDKVTFCIKDEISNKLIHFYIKIKPCKILFLL